MMPMIVLCILAALIAWAVVTDHPAVGPLLESPFHQSRLETPCEQRYRLSKTNSVLQTTPKSQSTKNGRSGGFEYRLAKATLSASQMGERVAAQAHSFLPEMAWGQSRYCSRLHRVAESNLGVKWLQHSKLHNTLLPWDYYWWLKSLTGYPLAVATNTHGTDTQSFGLRGAASRSSRSFS